MSTERNHPSQPDIVSDSTEAASRRENFHHFKAVRRLNKKLNRILGLPKESAHDWTLLTKSSEAELVSWYDFRRSPLPERPTAITVVQDLVIEAVNMSSESFIPLYSLFLLAHYPTPENPSKGSILAEFKNKADLGKLLQARRAS